MLIAIISDIHEDIVNLQKTLDQLLKLNIDRIVCLGDVVGFDNNYYKYEKTRSAQKCIHLLKNYSDINVAGNHDLNASKCLPYFRKLIGFPDNWYTISMEEKERKYQQKFFLYKDEAKNDLSKQDKEFMKDFNSWEILDADTLPILFSHFIYPDINGNMTTFNNTKKGFSQHFEWMEKLKVNISFVGHAHINGVGIAKKKSLKIKKNSKHTLSADPQIILCPVIAEGKYKNGFVLFDSKTMMLEVVSL